MLIRVLDRVVTAVVRAWGGGIFIDHDEPRLPADPWFEAWKEEYAEGLYCRRYRFGTLGVAYDAPKVKRAFPG